MSKLHIETTINGEPAEFLCEPDETLLERAPQRPGPDRHEGRLRDGRLRRLFGDSRRPAGAVLPGARRRGAGTIGDDDRRRGAAATPCTRFSRSFSSTRRCSAASARRGSSSRPRRCSTRIRIPTKNEVRYWLAGNLCRCTGYDKIVRAVLDAAAEMRKRGGMSERSLSRASARGRSVTTAWTRSPAAPTTAPTSRCRACSTAWSSAARTRTRASCRSTRAPQRRCRASKARHHRPGLSRSSTPSSAMGEGAMDLNDMADNLLARDKALYHGHAVAAVAATIAGRRARGGSAGHGASTTSSSR